MKQYKMWAGVILVAVVILVGIGFFFHLTTNKTLPNTLYTAKLSEEQKAQLTTQYKLDINSTIFETKFKVTDNIKSYIYYVELYQQGEYLGTYVENFGNFSERQGSIVTAFSINRGEPDTGKSLKWTSSFIDGGYCSYPNVAFPNGFTPSGAATSTIASAGADGASIVPETPIILANIGFHGESNTINSYDCEYLMENPSAIAEYECVYLVKCIFSEKDELELEKTYLNSETATTIQPQAGELGDLRPMVMINGINIDDKWIVFEAEP